MLTSNDLKILVAKGIKPDQVTQQLENFTRGFPFINLDRPAIQNDGIIVLPETEINRLARLFELNATQKRIVKFVPASGAATRMFKDLFDFLNNLREGKNPQQNVVVKDYFSNIQHFAFWPALTDTVALKGLDLSIELQNENLEPALSYLLERDGLNYGNLPKGLLLFHKYEHHARTPMEEHMVEAAHYATDGAMKSRLHFTVSPEHKEAFNRKLDSVRSSLEKSLGVKFEVDFSIQKASTDMVAVDMNNHLFREPDGSLTFRPGGHGALLENLNAIDADVIFIKNIDNVVPDHLKSETYRYKMALAGLLLELQEKIYQYGKKIQALEEISESQIEEVLGFLKLMFNFEPPQANEFKSSPKQGLINALKKPIRICGMVRNQGEPGGGPFWVKQSGGNSTLQIVESSQVNMEDKNQKNIFSQATHFNPVDLVCAVKDWNGNHLDLMQFRDPSTGFIAIKSKDGKELKAQELPGLWNGAMAFWNTLFVEVPIETFNPVKTVNDLLRPNHQ
jgi:hypothetical protein